VCRTMGPEADIDLLGTRELRHDRACLVQQGAEFDRL
jgi:hypothetical protein